MATFRRGKWMARVRHNGRQIYLGDFESLLQAVRVEQTYKEANGVALTPHEGTVKSWETRRMVGTSRNGHRGLGLKVFERRTPKAIVRADSECNEGPGYGDSGAALEAVDRPEERPGEPHAWQPGDRALYLGSIYTVLAISDNGVYLGYSRAGVSTVSYYVQVDNKKLKWMKGQ